MFFARLLTQQQLSVFCKRLSIHILVLVNDAEFENRHFGQVIEIRWLVKLFGRFYTEVNKKNIIWVHPGNWKWFRRGKKYKPVWLIRRLHDQGIFEFLCIIFSFYSIFFFNKYIILIQRYSAHRVPWVGKFTFLIYICFPRHFTERSYHGCRDVIQKDDELFRWMRPQFFFFPLFNKYV